MLWNIKQTPESELGLENCPQTVRDMFWDFMGSVPLLGIMSDPARKHARDMPRDAEGRIIVDVTHPHILENMDYFRPAALHYKETGRYCDYSPNPNPSSDFMKWFTEELRRCLDGYVRESDGEWITGDYYFFLNYFQIRQNRRISAGRRMAEIFTDFPRVWDGHYLWSHYLWQARQLGEHACQLASRQKGKSYFGASMLLKRLLIGDSGRMTSNVHSVVTASNTIYLNTADRILSMFTRGLEHCRTHTEFRSSLLRESMNDMTWETGYIDNERGKGGAHNTVTGISSGESGKLRGSRAALVLFEEMGNFPSLLDAYNKDRPLVEDQENVFGQLVLIGTTGDRESDFASIQEIMYSPEGYNMHSIDNVYDREGLGKKKFVFFFPSYLDYPNAYDSDGNSDVTKALLSICSSRDHTRRSSNDPSTLVTLMAENPIVPQEAILKSIRNIFPVTEINTRIAELDANPHEYDDVWTGTLVMNKHGKVEFVPSGDRPLHDFPLKDSMRTGALEIYAQPIGEDIPYGRYIIGFDPVDDDAANDNSSLASMFVLDLFTDTIVAEYTGRTERAEQCYELLRLLCIYYNATCLYENNIKGTFAYFSKMNALHLLADTPEFLQDKQLVKGQNISLNKSKGLRATAPVNNFANELLIKWLTMPVETIRTDSNGERVPVSVPNLYRVRSRALLKECSLYTPATNVDRIRAMGMLMLYRESKIITVGGDLRSLSGYEQENYLGDDPFFKDNWTPEETSPYGKWSF